MTKQIRNRELIDLLLPDFQARNEPNFAWGNVLSAATLFPALRGLWPMSAVAATSIREFSGNALNAGINNTVMGSQDLIPYIELNGTTAYLSIADTTFLDIIGNETYIDASIRGLSIGGWFYFDALGSLNGLMTKDNNSSQRSYRLTKTAGNLIQFGISNTGSASVTVDSAAVSTAGQWIFACGVFVPSTSIRVYLNNNAPVINTTSIPATIFNSSSALEFGRWAGTNYLDGRISICFLTASALPNSVIKSFYHQTRPLFGRIS